MIRCLLAFLPISALASFAWAAPPNIILIMTDDQGYGDLGVHGNPIVRTPNLDAMAQRSARWEYFYVSPVCAPTRACLMAGRYNYRTRAIDTYRGRAMMDTDELTLAELLKPAGYATGIFGKWHLGDSYPLRPVDQGFDMALVHRGGGIGQPSDPPGAEGKYTDPILFRNGEPEPQHGYCTDVYFREGMRWAGEQHQTHQPFFLYLPTNCPHGPYDDVPAEKLAYYRQQTISADRFPKTGGNPVPEKLNVDPLRRVYAMIENIDDNVGRLFRWLHEQQLTDSTLVIFITDNGPASVGYNAGLRGRKGEVFDGGIRSPAFFHWPGHFPAGLRQGRVAAHIDILPTLLELCGAQPPSDRKIDGRSLLSALNTGQADWPERTLFFQWHRGDQSFARHNCAVRSERWKLVHPSAFGKESFEGEANWQLFDVSADPFEQRDLAPQNPELVRDLQQRYDKWFDDVSQTRPDNYAPPRIIVGSPHEELTVLTRQDWRGANWGPDDLGHWLIDVAEPGGYEIRLRFRSASSDGAATLQIKGQKLSTEVASGAAQALFTGVKLAAGPQEITGWVDAAGAKSGVMFLEIRRE
jgi:arylsulfatase/arylsulfatase A